MSDSDESLTDDERIWLALDRYVAGDASASEEALVRDWLAADASREQIVTDLRRIRSVVLAPGSYQPAPAAWERLLRRVRDANIAPAGDRESRARTSAPRRSTRISPMREPWLSASVRKMLAVAATVVITAGASALFMQLRSTRQAALIAQRLHDDSSRTIVTPRGRRSDVRLPDGTHVSLAPESRVTWLVAADTLARDVQLEGEAYFDVVHDDAKPFRVHVRNVVIRDVGTRFAVRAYANDRAVRVVVTHGSVRVRATSAPAGSGSLVDAGMLSVTDSTGATSVRNDADTARYNAFVRGEMRFVGVPLRSVIGELSRWYDVDMRLADKAIGDRRVTATLSDQTLPDVLSQLSIALNLHATRTGRIVLLRGD